MQPDTHWSGAQFQAGLAAAVSNPESDVPVGLDARGIAVYRRLVHNNIASFLERCFSDSTAFIDEATWRGLKNRFLSEGKPESPYFKDIPEQFLQFVRRLSDRPLSENVLAMMEFETDLLHAETALRLHEPAGQADERDLLGWAESSRLKHYPVDFVSSGLTGFEEGAPHVLTWRNAQDETCYQAVGEIDVFLLGHFQEQDDSTADLLESLRELTGNSNADSLLRERIAHWLDQAVLVRIPKQPT